MLMGKSWISAKLICFRRQVYFLDIERLVTQDAHEASCSHEKSAFNAILMGLNLH